MARNTTSQGRLLALLGLPTLGLAAAITVVSTYLPVLARTVSSSTTTIGLIIAAEGVMALFLPLLSGAWSDRLRTRWGARLPFLALATPPAVTALVVMGFTHSLLAMGLTVAAFFAAYFVAYEPYRALYPDLVGDEDASRSQGSQALWRGGGTLLAIVGGGLLFSLAKPLPFVVAGGVLGALIVVFAVELVRTGTVARAQAQRRRPEGDVRQAMADVLRLVREHRALQLFLVANALWELSLAALKTFVVLYITRGLGHSTSFASAAIGATAVFILLGTVVSGRLGDRLGPTRVLEPVLWIYGLGLLLPFALSSVPAVVAGAAPVLGFGGAVLMTLPFAVLMPLMPRGAHGAVTGYYSLSRGLGVMVGPVLAGGAISLLGPVLSSTHGYAAMWGICSVSVLASIPFVRALRRCASED